MKTPRSSPWIIPGSASVLDPQAGTSPPRGARGRALPCNDVSESHTYPSRSKSFEEPPFSTADSNRTIMEHLLKVPWLSRVPELGRRTGEAAHALDETANWGIPGAELSSYDLMPAGGTPGTGGW